RWLDGPGMASMWKTAVETGQSMCCLIDPADLPAVSAMCRRHPDTPVVIDHFARVGVTGKIESADVAALCGLARHKRVRGKVSAFYARGKRKPPYLALKPMTRRGVEAFGPSRLMWASDAPYQVVPPHTYEASLELVRDRLDFLDEAGRTALLRGTAEKTFFFDA